MNLSQKITRMATGYDKYHVYHDPEIPCGEAETIAKEEAEKHIDKYIDSLEVFHKDAMEVLKHLDLYSTDDRLSTKTLIVKLIKQGEELKEFVLDGDVYTTD